MADTTNAQTREFKAELKQLLEIITHSLYSNREIFLRELISNASDAINRIKFDSISHEELLEGDQDWKIKIATDAEKGTLTISDNGIGMSPESIVENLGTIAQSGTKAFMKSLKEAEASARPELIGQFGVGFYSAFMVADKVSVHSRMAGDPEHGVLWESDGKGEYTVEPASKEKRGTEVTLHLKEDAKEYQEVSRLTTVVKKFSDFLEHPVAMDIESEDEEKNKVVKEETINTQKAIWLRSKSDVSQEEYTEFYKQVSHDYDEPAAVIHTAVEGRHEFRMLLFIPKKKPYEYMWGQPKVGPRLYIQRVLIMDNCEQLLPAYLAFVKGVVDSSDLPLNISRELLQSNPLLEKMQKDVVKNVLRTLSRMLDEEYDKYVEFFTELGSILKEGIRWDWDNRQQVADLLLFEATSTEPGKYLTLAQYVEQMPEDQNEIYYIIGETRSQIEHSPYLESIRAKGHHVLLMTEPIDELVIPSLQQYKEKTFKAVDAGDLKVDEEEQTKQKEASEKYKSLLEHLNKSLDDVSEVRLSTRLTESASCLVAGAGAMTAHMERLMQKMAQQDVPTTKRILELNPEHAVVKSLLALHEQAPEDDRIVGYGRLLFDQAVIAEGSKIDDPSAFAKRINELLTRDLGTEG